MASCSLSVDLKFKWWVSVYLKTLIFFCVICQREPNYETVGAFIAQHGMSQKVKSEPAKR